MARTNRGGSVLGFSIATLVMAGLLVGGAYTLRQLTTQQTAVAQNETPQPQAKPETNQSTNDKADTGNQKSNPPQDNNTPTSAPNSSSAGATSANELPQTGPGSLLSTVAALGLLSATAIAYARSRRPELSL